MTSTFEITFLLLVCCLPKLQTIANNVYTDDLVFSGTGSGCNADDEDDCSQAGSGDHDALVTPIVKIHTTPAPPFIKPQSTTTTTTTQSPLVVPGSGEGPCDDDEDCEGSGTRLIDNNRPKPPSPHKPKPATQKPPIKPSNNRPSPDEGQDVDNNPDIIVDPVTRKVPARNTAPSVEVFTVNMTEMPPKKPLNPITTRKPYVPIERRTERPPRPEPDDSWNIDNSIDDGVGGDYSDNGDSLASAPKPNIISQFGINVGLIAGIAVGLMILVCILVFALYKYKSRDEGSYKCDESKNYPYGSPRAAAAATATAASGKHSPQVNGAYGTTKPAGTNNKPKKKDVKEWYV